MHLQVESILLETHRAVVVELLNSNRQLHSRHFQDLIEFVSSSCWSLELEESWKTLVGFELWHLLSSMAFGLLETIAYSDHQCHLKLLQGVNLRLWLL